MDQSEKRGADGKLQPLPRSPSSVLQKLELLEEGEALESLRLSDQGDEEACQAGEEGEEVPGSSKSNPAASEGVPAASMLAPPRPVRRQQPAYAQRASECRSSPCSAGYGQTDWHPQQPVSPVYYMPQFEAYSPEAPLGSPGAPLLNPGRHRTWTAWYQHRARGRRCLFLQSALVSTALCSQGAA